MTSADSYRCDYYCLAGVFQTLPAPPKHYGVFDVFADFQSFFDDRFLPQGKQILTNICQVRPIFEVL